MFERFTDNARKVMKFANMEAQRLNHEFIDTEHILLGFIRYGIGIGAQALKNLGGDFAELRKHIDELVSHGPEMVTMGKLPQTPRAKKVIEYAMEESRNLKHDYVGTEHLLLGLLREGEGVAATVLQNAGLIIESTRLEVVRLLKSEVTSRGATSTPTPAIPIKYSLINLSLGICIDSGLDLDSVGRVREILQQPHHAEQFLALVTAVRSELSRSATPV